MRRASPVGERLLADRVEELQDADHPAASGQRHREDRPGVELLAGVAAPARVAGDVVDRLGAPAGRHGADDPLPDGDAEVLDLRRGAAAHDAEEEVARRLVDLPDRARLGPAELLGLGQGEREHATQVERGGELETDLEQRLLLPDAALQVDRRSGVIRRSRPAPRSAFRSRTGCRSCRPGCP